MKKMLLLSLAVVAVMFGTSTVSAAAAAGKRVSRPKTKAVKKAKAETKEADANADLKMTDQLSTWFQDEYSEKVLAPLDALVKKHAKSSKISKKEFATALIGALQVLATCHENMLQMHSSYEDLFKDFNDTVMDFLVKKCPGIVDKKVGEEILSLVNAKKPFPLKRTIAQKFNTGFFDQKVLTSIDEAMAAHRLEFLDLIPEVNFDPAA